MVNHNCAQLVEVLVLFGQLKLLQKLFQLSVIPFEYLFDCLFAVRQHQEQRQLQNGLVLHLVILDLQKAHYLLQESNGVCKFGLHGRKLGHGHDLVLQLHDFLHCKNVTFIILLLRLLLLLFFKSKSISRPALFLSAVQHLLVGVAKNV